MEKITLKALELAGFQNADKIAQIIAYVPNPRIATEMLLGIHEPQVLQYNHRFREYRHDKDKLYEILSIDELGNKVTYKKYEQKTDYVYYITKEDYTNKVYQTERPKDYHTSGYMPTTGFNEREGSMDLQEFEANYSKVLHPDTAIGMLENWENYGKPKFEYTSAVEVNELPF
jgi:hypothetical protein